MRRLWTAIGTLFCLCLMAPAPLWAQNGDGEASSQNWHLLVDQSAQLTLEEVIAQRSLFQRLEQPAYSSLGPDKAVWLQVRIPPQTEPRWLWLTAPRLDYLDFYLLRDGALERQLESGEQRPRAARILAARPYLFSLPSDGHPREAYLRLESDHPLLAHFQLIDESGLMSLENTAYLYGALLGVLALLALHNLLRYATVPRRNYLWLSLLQLALMICASANLGVLAAWVPDLAQRQSMIADLSALLAGMLLLVYTRDFLHDQRRRWSSILLACGVGLLAIQGLAILLGQGHLQSLITYSLISLGALIAAGICLFHWRRGYRPARLAAAGMLALALGLGGFALILAGVGLTNSSVLLSLAFWSAPLSGLLQNFALIERQHRIQSARLDRFTAEAVNSAETRTRSDFLGRISHEIRAPLNGVLGMTELLIGTSLSAKQRDYVRTIHSSGNELLNLINELLDIPKLQAGDIELEQVQFDLHALIADCLDICRARAEQQGVELISLIQPQVPHIIAGDPARLRQIVLSLLDNALRQTEAGEVLLRVTRHDSAPRMRITVQDSGRPLDEAERDALLGAALDNSDFLDATSRGARIGLLIARQLTSLMHGTLGASSDVSQGNTLWIELPLPIKSPVEDEERALPLRGVRMLIVDDNETCRKVLAQQGMSWGMEVHAVTSGKEALAQLRTKALLDEYYDIVLLDQEMPGMSGLQLAMRIKEDLNLKHDLLLIMLTGISHAPSKVAARNAGIRCILAKPVAGYTLKTTLADELARRPGRRHEGPPVIARRAEPAGEELPDGFRILVAEDDSTSTKVMRGMLTKLGLQPDMVSNGEEALQAIKARPYDLVLMDCEMPLLDGYSATRRLREWESIQGRPRTPVVALTAHVFSEHRERARNAGMDGHMSKPVELSELRELVRYWGEARASTRAE
ncbi:response regulator [Stutzerimonas tarimensis]|uniref:histidine kinase n=1 Tax=Stutzerimonas tarimensis TaxID=1507735 RepID=A0ABV7T3L4_9GAMM